MLVPKLRFKEFNDEWQQKELKDISNILSGKRIPKGLYAVNYNTGIPYITVSSMGDFFINEKEVQYITKDVEKYILKYKVNTNDIILSVAGTLGKLNVVQKNLSGANLTENCNKITNIDNNSYYLYVYYYLKFCIDKYILLLSTKSSQPKIALDRIRNMTINLPSLEEQTKIANFLSLIDRKIELQEKLVENLKLYKKGLLQKVFSNNQGWKSAKLGDIFQYEQPNNYIVENAEYNSNYTIPVLTANKGFILGYTNETNTYNKGKCIIFDDFTMDFKYVDFPFKVKSSAIKILTTKKEYNINFMYQLLKTITLEPISHQRHYISMVQNIEVTIPSIEEQNRIANLFTSLDKKIELETKKLQDLKTYKKGLLQKMFI